MLFYFILFCYFIYMLYYLILSYSILSYFILFIIIIMPLYLPFYLLFSFIYIYSFNSLHLSFFNLNFSYSNFNILSIHPIDALSKKNKKNPVLWNFLSFNVICCMIIFNLRWAIKKKKKKKSVSGVGFEPTPPYGDQNTHDCPCVQARLLHLESGALDRSAILTTVVWLRIAIDINHKF